MPQSTPISSDQSSGTKHSRGAFFARVNGQPKPSGVHRDPTAAGHVSLELRNVVAKYDFERSHGFPGIQPNSDHRDHSRLSCAVWETQLGPNARMPAGMLAGVGRSLREQESPRFL